MDFFHPKLITSILVAAVYLREWKAGRLREMASRLRHIKIGFYLSILAFFSFLAVGMFFFDPALLNFVQNLNHPLFDAVSRGGGFLGKEANPWMFLIGWYFLALLLQRLAWSALSFGAIFSSTLASVFCHISKMFFLRARPNSSEGPFSFFNFEAFLKEGGRFYSLPSGDVVVVAAAAYFVLLRTKNIFLRVILFLLPLATAFSRMEVNKHWPSDTLLSLGFGLISALFVENLLENSSLRGGRRPRA